MKLWLGIAATLVLASSACGDDEKGTESTAAGGADGHGGTGAGGGTAGVCTPGQDETCNEDPAATVFGGACEPDGTCTCSLGFAETGTGKCAAKVACTPGMDQTCNAEPAMAALAGSCNPDGTCTCNSGFTLDLHGQCVPR